VSGRRAAFGTVPRRLSGAGGVAVCARRCDLPLRWACPRIVAALRGHLAGARSAVAGFPFGSAAGPAAGGLAVWGGSAGAAAPSLAAIGYGLPSTVCACGKMYHWPVSCSVGALLGRGMPRPYAGAAFALPAWPGGRWSPAGGGSVRWEALAQQVALF